MKPLAIDLYAGLGGWADGLLDAGYRVVGFDNGATARYSSGAKYPVQLVIPHGSRSSARKAASAQL